MFQIHDPPQSMKVWSKRIVQPRILPLLLGEKKKTKVSFRCVHADIGQVPVGVHHITRADKRKTHGIHRERKHSNPRRISYQERRL